MSSTRAALVAACGRCAGYFLLVLWTGTGAAHAADLGGITSYTIQLQNTARDFDRIATSDHDLVVIEPTIASESGVRRLSESEIRRLKTKPDGNPRIVLAYLSIGEAEVYRDYWRPEWTQSPPDFLISENCQWRGNHLVRFWQPAWRALLYGAPGSEVERLMAEGYDGVSLDRVDVYEDLDKLYPDARRSMIQLVTELGAAARKLRPGAIVMAHNAENLLSDAGYRHSIDAVLKEDLLFGLKATGSPNPPASVAWSKQQLAQLRDDGKPILVAEYLTDRDQADATELALLDSDFLPGIFARALDGSDPFQPSKPLAETMGTPERGAETCQGVWPRGDS